METEGRLWIILPLDRRLETILGRSFPDDASGGPERKKKEPKKKEWGGLMETDGNVEKQKTVFSTLPCKTLLGFAPFPQARRR